MDLRQQPGGHPKGDEVFSDSAFLCAMCGLPYAIASTSASEKTAAAVPQPNQTTRGANAKRRGGR